MNYYIVYNTHTSRDYSCGSVELTATALLRTWALIQSEKKPPMTFHQQLIYI